MHLNCFVARDENDYISSLIYFAHSETSWIGGEDDRNSSINACASKDSKTILVRRQQPLDLFLRLFAK
jgi:hypothetical protein